MFNNYEQVACPVCKSKLGERNKSESYIVECTGDSCGQLWMWKKNSKKPLPIVKQKEAARCGCGRCGK